LGKIGTIPPRCIGGCVFISMKILITESQYIYTLKYEVLKKTIDDSFDYMSSRSNSFCNHEIENIIDFMIYETIRQSVDSFHGILNKKDHGGVEEVVSFLKKNLINYIKDKFKEYKKTYC
jgi:hypothetical protein